MRHGDVIQTRTVAAVAGRNVFTWRAPKGKVFQLLVLGVSDKDADFDAVASLEAMGWTAPPSLTGVPVPEEKNH